MTNAPGYSFTSHIDGKNARVDIYPDRIEWERKAVSGGKVAAGILTLGVSTLATGIRGKNTEMIPIKSITSVTSKKGAGLNTVVSLASSGGVIEFRTSHKEAAIVKDYIQQLMLWDPGAATLTQVPPVETAPASPDFGAQLQQLKGLLDAGVLTQEEYDAKKTEILARM